jgi:microcystin-dependent protein
MPSDSNGVYSLPPGYQAITGETIQASQHNPPLEDLATAQTARLMRSGAAPMTGPLKLTDGDAGAPSLTFNTGVTAGLFKTASGIGVAVNGTMVAEITGNGIKKGGRFIGELIPFSGAAAQPYTVFPYGQTLLRADYPDLWGFAQAEIAAGSQMYNNGNGTTTFGILDARGRVLAARDNMGGVAAGRLTGATVAPNGNTLGGTGGTQTHTLGTDQLPVHDHPVYLYDGTHRHADNSNPFKNGSYAIGGGGPPAAYSNNAGSQLSWNTDFATSNVSIWSGTGGTGTQNSTATTGSGTAHNNVQPTLVCNYLLFAGV